MHQFGIRKRYKKLVILQVFRIFIAVNQIYTRIQAMITNNKTIEIFCAIDEFCKNFDAEIEKNLLKGLPKPDGKQRRNRKGQMCESEIMTILLCYHFGTYRNFKHYYVFFVKTAFKELFPNDRILQSLRRTDASCVFPPDDFYADLCL